MEAARSLTVIMSFSASLPASIASMINNVAMTLVTLAIGKCAVSFSAYKTVPVDASIKIQPFAAILLTNVPVCTSCLYQNSSSANKNG